MEASLIQLRSDIDIINPFDECDSRRKPKFTKTGRLKAVTALNNALKRRQVVFALTAVSKLEMIRGPTEEVDKLLGWAEVSCVVFRTLQQVCDEIIHTKTSSRSGAGSMRPVFMDCFRSVLKLALQHGPRGVLRHLVRPFLSHAHDWLSEPLLREILADQIWQSARDLLQDEGNRALLQPLCIRTWTDACFEQLTGRGALCHSSNVVTNIAGEVLQIFATSAESYDTLSQIPKGASFSTMLGRNFGYGYIAERCCTMLIVAESMPHRKAREAQSVAFRTLCTVLSEHALDFLDSNALTSISNISLKPLLACWSEKKYHVAAVSFCKMLLLLTPSDKKLIDTVRNRVLVDLREESSSAIIRTGQEISTDYVDTAAACFTFCECLEFADAAETRHGVAILWLRAAFAIMSRRVLKNGTNVLAEATDVLDQCSKAAVTVTAMLKRHGNLRENDYLNVVRWCTMITNVTAVIAENIHSTGARATSFAKSSWQELYKVLREHAMKAKYSVRSRGTTLNVRGSSAQPEDLILQTLGLLCGLELVDNATLDYSGTEVSQVGSSPYPIARLLPTSAVNPTPYEIEYFRNLVCRTGLVHGGGGHLRSQLLASLLDSCQQEDEHPSTQGKVLEEASAATLALVRGECGLGDMTALFHRSRLSANSLSLIALHSFHVFFGLRPSCQKIAGEGSRLVRSIVEQDMIWKDCNVWIPQTSLLASSAAQAMVSDGVALSTSGEAMKLSSSRHFSIDSQLTESLEKKMLGKLAEMFSGSVVSKLAETSSVSRRTLEDAMTDCEPNWNEVGAFLNSKALARGLRIITFLGCYLFQGIRLGLISFSGSDDGSKQDTAQELGRLLVSVLRSAAAADPEHLIMNNHLTQEAMKWSSRLFCLIDSDVEILSGDALENTWLNLSQMLSSAITSLATSISKYVFRKLEEETTNNVELIQHWAQSDFVAVPSILHDTRNRVRTRKADEKTKKRRKRRRTGSHTFWQENDNSNSSRDSEESRTMDERIGMDLDDRSEDSDDLLSFAYDENDNSRRAEATHAAQNIESKTSFWKEAFGILEVTAQELKLCREPMLEIFVNGLKAVDDAERVLSPDGFERSTLFSSLVDASILDARRSVWGVLHTIGTGTALKTAATDVLKLGKSWKRLEQTAHDYISLYTNLLEVRQRKQYPVQPDIEISRILFLDSARMLFEKAMASKVANRDAQTQHPESELRGLASEIVGVSEYFRSRHAFRMPRVTRIAYIRFACSFVNLVHNTLAKRNDGVTEGSEGTSLMDTARILQKVLCKFLMDAEGIVRMVACKVIPRTLTLQEFSQVGGLERVLNDCLPHQAACSDGEEAYGRAVRDSQEGIDGEEYSTWALSDIERNAFLVIEESFQRLGASAKGFSTLMVLAELAVSCEDLVPYCVVEIINRVSENARFLVCAYHALLRLCAALNYRSPNQFYASYARLLLPKWFETQESCKMLYSFPASLFVDYDHHKEGILFDWMREHQACLLSHMLVQERAITLDLTSRFADALHEDVETLLENNILAFSLLYPMQFTDGLHDRGKLLWHAVDSLLGGKSIAMMFEKKAEVINAFVRSVSTNWQDTILTGTFPPQCRGNMGFSRDTRSLKPPQYDPLVIALAINHLFASHSDLFIVQKTVLQGSLFAEVRDEHTGILLADRFVDFLKECQRTNLTLLRVLISILRFFEGPPSPQPKRSRLDAYFGVGMLWRMLDDTILIKPKSERLTFFKLIAKGFHFEETVRDAIWLLSDVQTKLVRLQHKYPDFAVSESDICVEDNYRGYLISMTDTRERQMYELLSTVSPELVSIMVSTTGSNQSTVNNVASQALHNLLNLCSEEGLWSTILSNGPFPYHKLFKDVRRVYERARSFVEVANVDDTVNKLLNSLARFRDVHKRLASSDSPVNILACLQEIYQLLDERTVNKLSKRIKSEAWLRSNGMDQHTIPQINDTLTCFIELIYKCTPSKSREKGSQFSAVYIDKLGQHVSEKEVFDDCLLQELARVLSILGLLHPEPTSLIQAETYHRSIPAKQISGYYEEVESGIRLSLKLLENLLQSNISLQAQIALDTLPAVLKTNDGRRIYGKERDSFGNLASFKGTDRTMTSTGGRSEAQCVFSDPLTGSFLCPSTFPDLRSAALWSLPKDQISADYSCWLRKLCTVLARNCRSNALNVLASACFSSYKVSCDMLPYLLMDIICDLDDVSCSDVSKLLRHHILLSDRAPVPLLRAFVYALDVLCQIGLEVVSSKGVLSWVRNGQQSHTFPYYYVLDVPYLEAAEAALRSGAYFSVLRFAQLYVDQRLTRAELKQSTRGGTNHRSDRRFSSCPLKNPAVESAELVAREKVIPLVREAMLHVGEPDIVRAFGENCSLARSAANTAVLDEDWSRSLSALGVATESVGLARSQVPEEGDHSSARDPISSADFRKELDVLHSFIGLGSIHIATDYWEGLRNRVLRMGILEKCDQDTSTQRCLHKLNELRYAAAWKLEQWESPPVLPEGGTSGVRDAAGCLGFHKAIYLALRCLKTGRFNNVLGILFRTRNTILQQLRDGSSALSAKSIFESASRLYVCHTLERLAFQGIIPSTNVKHAEAVRNSPTGNHDIVNKFFLSSQPHHATGEIEPAGLVQSLDYAVNRNLYNEDVVYQILGDQYGVDAEVFRDGLVLSRDGFHSANMVEDLPVVLTRCLRKNDVVARMSATISARVLAKGGVGAWPRATSCLGTPESAQLANAPQKDVIAWRLQETRLRWSANHDAPSKKKALAAVKDIISNNLGGKALDRNSNDVSESSSCQQSLSWQSGGMDEQTLALLRLEACCLAANWSLDMKTHEPMDLFQMYLESGLTAASRPSKSGQLVGRAHFAMASFADTQINNIDSYRRSRKYDGMVIAVKEMEEKISNLKKMKKERLTKSRSQSRASRRNSRSSRSDMPSEAVTEKQIGRDLDLLIRMDEKKARQDRARLEKLNETYQNWQMLACRHFALSLCAGSAQDLRAAFRMVALWLDAGPMRNKITQSIIQKSEESSAGHRKIMVPVSKLLPLAPQLASRLNKSESMGDAAFQDALSGTIAEMAGQFPAHCLWQLLALSNATRDSGSQEKYSSLYRGDEDKKDAADEILNRLQQRHGNTVSEMKTVADAYILLSETDPKRKKDFLDLRGYDISKLGELTHVPIPTIPIPLNATDHFRSIPHISGFEQRASVCAGLSKPLRVVCIGSDGNCYPQMVKGRDDLRGDAVMEQMFTILNTLLEKDSDAARRSLHVRTYRIIPLSPFSGVMQFVSNTKQFRQVLVDRETEVSGKPSRLSLHERYHPKDHKHEDVLRKAFDYLRMTGGGPHKVVQFLASIWQRFQPAFRFFFTEQWPDPGEWFSRQLSYSRSVAVMSMVGFILGLGDRHLSNILLDVSTAEVVHIDFGIAFEQGKLLPTPEHMPFRLTRDLVDGFGIAGVEGVFRRCSEITLSVMRNNKDVMLTVIEVLLHDPMYSWALTPEEVLREQNRLRGSDQDNFESNECSRSVEESSVEAVARAVNKKMNGSKEAQRALNRISEKLDGLEGTERLSVEAHVARLIDEAQAFHVIAPVFPGWSPWL